MEATWIWAGGPTSEKNGRDPGLSFSAGSPFIKEARPRSARRALSWLATPLENPMSTSSTPTALVTNSTGYAGPPAVDALGEAGFRVLVHDRQFSDQAVLEQFLRLHPHAECVRAESPAGLPNGIADIRPRTVSAAE